jgi:hypothetical protein
VITERTPEGWVLRIRPEGTGRFGGAFFICVWLCGWAIAEVAVLSILLFGAYSLLTGNQLAGQIKSLPPGPTLGVGAFLLVWITGWTFGGIAAISELLRLVSSEDRLTVGPSGTTIFHRRGPFAWTNTIPVGEIRNVRVATRFRRLSLETRTRVIAFAPLASAADAREALETLRRELHLPTAQEPGDALPEGWEETITPEGQCAVVRDVRTRRKQSMVMGGVAAFTWVIALVLGWTAISSSPTLGPAIVVAIFAALFAAGAVWLDTQRLELRLGSATITCQRRLGRKLYELFQIDRLELTLSTDSDGDVWYRLDGVSSAPVDPLRSRRRTRRRIAQAMNDPFEPNALGEWLAVRSGVPFGVFEPAKRRAVPTAARED